MGNVFSAKLLAPSCSPAPKTIETNKICSVSFKKFSKKHKGGPFAVFWARISGKKRRGDPYAIFRTYLPPRK